MITQSICNSFMTELFTGVHVMGTDVFKLALFRATDDITGDFGIGTANYSEMGADEVTGTGYTAGGQTLTGTAPVVMYRSGGVPVVVNDFDDTVWSTVTLTTRGALLYNSSKANKAVAVFDFGLDRLVENNDFTAQFPVADAVSAILRMLRG